MSEPSTKSRTRARWPAHRPGQEGIAATNSAISRGSSRMAAQAERSVELDTGHSPFLSQPDLVAGLLAGLAGAPVGADQRPSAGWR